VAPIRQNEARVDSTINTASAARSTRLNPSYWQYLCRRLTRAVACQNEINGCSAWPNHRQPLHREVHS
jgi:hypothetical protein